MIFDIILQSFENKCWKISIQSYKFKLFKFIYFFTFAFSWT